MAIDIAIDIAIAIDIDIPQTVLALWGPCGFFKNWILRAGGCAASFWMRR